MQKKDNLLIWALLAVLALSVALGLYLDPETRAAAQPAGEYQVQITEICAKNETIIADNDGRYRDYVELYNFGPETDLTGCRPAYPVVYSLGSWRQIFLYRGEENWCPSSWTAFVL